MALASFASLFCSVFAFVVVVVVLQPFQLYSCSASSDYSPRHVAVAAVWKYTGSVTNNSLVVSRRFAAELPAESNSSVTINSSFVLAGERTRRRDPFNSFNVYTGGWNISNYHYWTSVGFTAAPLFTIAAVWFVAFGLLLLVVSCWYCCCSNRNYSYSNSSAAYVASLVLLIIFTCAAVIGCGMLYTGQEKFHDSTTTTLRFVVGQADLVVENLQNLSHSLSAAKKVDIDQNFLPANVQSEIDAVDAKLNSSATDLSVRTLDNSKKIQNVLNTVRLALIIVAAVMLLLALLGFLFSVCGMTCLVSTLVFVGWVLVTMTFILCGLFLLLHNVTSDSCVAMEDWVTHPQEHTALDDILPCVDTATANDTLYQSRDVTFQLVNLVNQFISNVSNRNLPPVAIPFYYNQTGPLIPALCNPYAADLSNRTCATGEVDLYNASQVWKGYVCQTVIVSGSERCTTVGRLTPSFYQQLMAGVSVSQGLHRYGPFLVALEDCTYVRDAFDAINARNCPSLERYSKWVYVGLVVVSAAVMLSLVFWVIYARERRHRKHNQQFIAGAGHMQPYAQQKAR